jgi:hypothetical protein
MMPQPRQVWSPTASIIPQECGSSNDTTIKIKTAMTPQVVLLDDGSRRRRCHKSSYETTTQVGSDAASRPTRSRIELAVMPQVVLQDDDSSRRWCRKSSYETTNGVGNQAAVKSAVMPQERPCMVSYCFHSSIIPQECGSGIWCHYKDIRQHGSCSCSSMSSIMKELLAVSSIILIRWHGRRNWDFDLIQLKGEKYVLAGVC